MRTIHKNILNTATAVFAILAAAAMTGCIPENKIDLDLTDKLASETYARLLDQGEGVYNYIPSAYNWIDGAMLAAATDEADHAVKGSNVEKFQYGNWGPTDNPDNAWKNLYRGIRLAQIYLRNSEGYEETILRDISTQAKKDAYLEQCKDLEWMRNEVRVLRAYCYFELLKRYGDIPVIEEIYGLDDDIDMPKESYETVVGYIVDELDEVIPNLQENWRSYKVAAFGRVDKGMAMALKARVLLYYASPLNNPSNNLNRWKDAADAAKEVIDYGRYSLGNYATMFTGANGHQNPEAIFCHMTGSNNTPEKNNYPMATNGGKSGTSPSGNLVDAYENADGTPFSWSQVAPGGNPYAGRDPRLQMTVVVNNSAWNGRTMQIYTGGNEASGIQATTTGYYLKKFLTDGLDLELSHAAVHSWPLFRYGEVLLNYAEAMNEAYGPDTDNYGDGKTARWAVNEVRGRSGVGMPPVVASTQTEMRARIRHERRIELAFEDHRFWDVRRWGTEEAKAALGGELKGVAATKTGENTFTYTVRTVEKRVFTDKMMLYPIPQSEVLKSKGALLQNDLWD